MYMRSTVLLVAALAAACRPAPADGGAFGTTGGPPSTSTGASSPTTTAELGSDDTTAGAKLDVGTDVDDPLDHGCSPGPDEMPGPANPEGGSGAFSNIWVADTANATILKIDTRTMTERARYLTHPEILAQPSRTSVNLNGDVAVANRGRGRAGMPGQSGVTVISTRAETCVDRNGDGVLQTSSGPGDLLDWDADECVLWHQPFDAPSNRPVAWTTGTYDAERCRWVDTRVWTATSAGPNEARVLLLDGEDGSILGDVLVEGWVTDDVRIVYGGAVDSHNDFWFIPPSGDQLGHVRLDDLGYEIVQGPPHGNYGIFVDRSDRVLVTNGDVTRYDPADGSWVTGQCGCTQIVELADGALWTNALTEVDPVTLALLGDPPSGDEMPWGLSVDIDGKLMAVYFDRVSRFDLESGAAQTFYPAPAPSLYFYTYSDMTGWGLLNVAQPEG